MYSKLQQVIQNVPAKYKWYVEKYLEKHCSHADYQNISGKPDIILMSVTCPSCKFHSSLKKQDKDDFTPSHSSERPESSKCSDGSMEISSMVQDFMKMLLKDYCYEDDTIGFTVKQRISIILMNYHEICNEQGPEEAAKALLELAAINTLHIFSPQTHSKDFLPNKRDPKFSDIIHMDDERINKALLMFITFANQENGTGIASSLILTDYDCTVIALFLSELFLCMSCADPRKNPSAYHLCGPRLLFERLEKRGYRSTLEWAIREIENFSIMIDKLSEKLYLFENLKKCKKQEIKTILQIIFKYQSKYSEVNRETDQLLSVNPLFMPIFAILQFKISMLNGN